MNELPEQDHPTEQDVTVAGNDFGPRDAEPVELTRWEKIRIGTLRVIAVIGAFLFVSTLLAAFSGIYTSRPEFCRSCHNMVPYYESWQKSSHAHVSCIKCHFPPGAGEKIRGKMLGLVQLAKYVTSTEGPRPAAEVSDASCLRSGCHETRLLAGKVDFNGIPFDHAPHLTKMRRGKKLRCTSCHGQMVQGNHMSVTASTCFLCHFKGQQFNQGLGTCTRCHQIPTKSFDLGGGATFDHDLAYARGVNCTNCHGSLTRGEGEVPRERCATCHNRENDLARIVDHEFIHQTHVTEHKVDCLECHLTIEHSADPQRIEHAAAQCISCHPDHHRQQINMLEGVGAKTAPHTPNAMVGVRLTCSSCHKTKTVTASGNVLWVASTKACSECHDNTDIDRLWSIHQTLRSALDTMDACVADLREALANDGIGESRTSEIQQKLSDVTDDLMFLRTANGVHNIHYASSLTKSLVEQLTELCDELNIPPLTVELPTQLETMQGDRS